MLLKIYELINKIETEIGNGARVNFFTRDDSLIIHIDWLDDDFHAEHKFRETELERIVDNDIPLNRFIVYCKNAYEHKKKAR
jgi:hypothetical protein